MVENQNEQESLETRIKAELNARLAKLEQQLNEVAGNVNAKVDGHADALVTKWSNKLTKVIVDSRFTWAILAGIAAGIGVYSVMTIYICA